MNPLHPARHRRFLFRVATFVVMAALAHAQVRTSADLEMPKSHNPFSPYMPDYVPEPTLSNSPRLERLVRDGKLYLTLKDAIYLALENNLDLAIARYNLPIADTDLLRTKGGGSFRGVNTGVVQGTPEAASGAMAQERPGRVQAVLPAAPAARAQVRLGSCNRLWVPELL
jgi:hypothetical protein